MWCSITSYCPSKLQCLEDDVPSSNHLRLVRLIQQRQYTAQLILTTRNIPYKLVNQKKETSIHIAAECGNYRTVKYLIESGCNVDARDYLGRTPLLLAVLNNHDMTIKVLLEENANMDIKDIMGKSPFQIALASNTMSVDTWVLFLRRIKKDCRKDCEKVAEKLIQVNCPLSRAMYLRDLNVIYIMIKRGCPVNLRQAPGTFPPLHVAVELNYLEGVKLLMRNRVKVTAEDCYGRHALYYTYFTNREHSERKTEIVKALVSKKVLYKTSSYTTVLQFGDREVVRTVLASNINLLSKDGVSGCTPLHYLAKNCNPGVLDELEGKKYNVNASDRFGNTILTVASASGNIEMVQYLLERGADPNRAHIQFGYTPLYDTFVGALTYKYHNYVKVVNALLKYGADGQVIARADTLGLTVFDAAIKKIRYNMAEMVIAHLALLESQGLILNNYVVSKIEQHLRLRNCLKMCRRRLQMMKKITVYGKINLYYFLTTNEETIANYARNRSLTTRVEQICSKSHTVSSYCPTLGERITTAWQNAVDRHKAAIRLCELMELTYGEGYIIAKYILGSLTLPEIRKISQ